ncbi:hypothetical protein GCM10008018_66260 [Paenibacillus marchantiophytorum]|uniref:RNA-directed DNA polymerase n=1 Tax=Paenibacillus marchantiophytorum TaxID=1619310 RepID=A0ABQ1FHK4_9BACL|nr:reverse transcriptase family protein [Paenibacillus marchantiophytorum]GGA11925.1 hypothetical protein GCM10008018_66260 [Paenibacillus marchantiophytorum]
MLNIQLCKLKNLKSKKMLSLYLRIELYKLKDITKHYSTAPFEKEFDNGKKRMLYNPNKDYKQVLKRINLILQQIPIPNYVFGGIRERDYVQNATVHKDNNFYLLMDLKNFFPSTSDSYVYDFFKNKLGMSMDNAKIVTLLVTVPNEGNSGIRSLPQGFSTSPVLSYLSYSDMFEKIHDLAVSQGIKFSCYYDDLTFSSSNMIGKSFKNRVIEIVEQFNLKVNNKKTHLTRNINGTRITGTIVKNNTLFAPNKLQRKLTEKFNELEKMEQVDILNKREVIQLLCNTVQGCCSAIMSVERTRKFPHILRRVREIRRSV